MFLCAHGHEALILMTMNKLNTSIYIVNALLLSIGTASVSAAPDQLQPTVQGVLTGPVVAPLKDPTIKRAVELLQKNKSAQPAHEKPKKQNKPDSPIGLRNNKNLILGGPYMVPM